MQIRKSILFFIFINSCSFLYSQKEDYHWIVGYDLQPNKEDTLYSNSSMNFNYEPVNIYHETKHKINMAGGNSSICDNEGKALAHSNGQIIVNKNNDYIEDTINYSLDIPLNCNDWEYNNSGNAVSAVPSGLLGFQRILLLPLDSVYFVIYNTINKCNSSKIYRTLYSNFKIDENQSSKKLLQKDIVIHNESTISSMHGVRHGNGKDWWIVNFTDGFDSIITMLLSNEGVQYIRKESTGYIKKTDGTIGQIVFSPNGKKLLLYTGNYLFSDTGGGFCIWDFDRCTGKINDIKCIENKQNFIESGVAFSYDSKYFYLANGSHILQFETNEKNLLETKQIVAVFDSFYYIVPGSIHNPIKYSVNFSQLKLGPDGRIYIFPASATQRYLSYMDYPHESFDNVGVRQHAIYMPRLFTRTIPNIPEFRLGPDDNSPCDTLGLDNHPIAKFRYEPDRINYKRIRFTDLSYFLPESWSWDFGDGSLTVTERYPFYTYSQNGTYEVCLTVSNENSSHTSCRTVTIGTSGAEDTGQKAFITLFPNPVADILLVTLGEYIPQNGKIHIHDATGRVIMSQRLYYGHNHLNMTDLSPGLYFWFAEDDGVKMKRGKVVKM